MEEEEAPRQESAAAAAAMSKPWALQDLMTAVDAGHVHNIDSGKVMASRRSTVSSHVGRGRKGAPMPAPAVAVADASSGKSFEFSAAVSYSPVSPAGMVFSDGQLWAHQFPTARSPSAPVTAVSSLAASPVWRRSTSIGSGGGARRAVGVTKAGSKKKRVSFGPDGAADRRDTTGGQGKKSDGLLGCMGSTCGSSRNKVMEPARNANRKVVAINISSPPSRPPALATPTICLLKCPQEAWKGGELDCDAGGCQGIDSIGSDEITH